VRRKRNARSRWQAFPVGLICSLALYPGLALASELADKVMRGGVIYKVDAA